MVLFQILPKYNFQFVPEDMILFYKSLAAGGKKKSFFDKLMHPFDYSFIIECDKNNKISFYISCNDLHADMVKSILHVWLKDGADVYKLDHALETYSVIDTLYTTTKKNESNNDADQKIATYKNESIFMNIIGMLTPHMRIVIDFEVVKAAIGGNASYFSRMNGDVQLEVLLRVSAKTKYQRTEVKSVADRICTLTAANNMMRVDYKDSYRECTITGNELINITQIPSLFRKQEKEIYRINHLLPGQKTLDPHEFASGVYAGRLYHPQLDRDVRIGWKQLRKHLIITGATGSGKSSSIEEMQKDIISRKVKGEKDVPGFTFLDPAESSVLGVIDMILKLKDDGHDVEPLLKKVIYVDFSCEDYIFPISILNKGIKSTAIIDFFQSLFGDQKTIQVDRMVTSSINALLQDDDEYCIYDIERIFKEPEFCEKLRLNLKDNIYATDSVNFLNTKFNAGQTEPILNRIDPFRNTNQKKLMFGMTSRYDALKDVRKWMDEGYIILMNIKSLNNFDRMVICGYLSLRYYTAALDRPDNALQHFLINDESHHLQMPIYPRIAAETRKQGLSLVLMTQFLQQYDPDFLKSLLDNINTIISFKQGDTAAATLSRTIRSGDVTTDALKSLSTFIGYVSTEDNGKEKSVMIKVAPPYRYTNGKLVDHERPDEVNKNEVKNREFARGLMAKFCMPRKQAEDIVFHKQKDNKFILEEEEFLLEEGDSMQRVDAIKIEEVEVEWDD